MKISSFILSIALALASVSPCFPQDYVVGEGDLLHITVYDHPDLTTDVRIDGEGSILFPLVGQVKISGLSVYRASQKLEGLLADGYIISPHVSILIQEFRSQKATILGQVNKPGLYALNGYTTFLQLLSNAGDLTKEAGDKAIIKRKAGPGAKEEQIITLNLKRLVEMGDTSQNVQIIAGDSIYVMKAGIFYVTGEVKKADAYRFEEGMTVIKAITMAGGFTDKASKGGVKVGRIVDGKEKVLDDVKMDAPVRPDDVIVVPESFF
jgi:polysaccharide export outer membrane protein